MPRWWKSLCRQSRLHNQKEPRRAWESTQRRRAAQSEAVGQLDQLEPRLLMSASTVDFEGLSAGNLTSGSAYYVDPSGYRFRDSGPNTTGLHIESNSGDENIRPRDWHRGIIVDNDGTVFDLASFDYRQRGGDVATVTVTGTLAAGGTVTDTFVIDSSNNSGTQTLNWTGLDSVDIDLHRWALFDDFVLSTSGGGSNAAPTDINLTNTVFAEDEPTDALVGTLSTIDPDAGDTHTYTLVGGDTGSFTIANGNELRTVGTFDYETQDNYSVTVRTTDPGSLTYDEVFALTVTDVVEGTPTAAISGATSIDEGGTYTLSLTTTDATATGWDIDWGDGSAIETVGNVANATHVYADGSNSYNVTATAATDQGSLTSNSLALSVANVAPVLEVMGDAAVQTGETYTLTLGATDPGNDTLTQWAVDWGDGSAPDVLPGTATSATHIFSAAGTPSIQVTATDEDGTFSATALPITVSAAANPTATISGVGLIDEGGTYALGLNVVDATVTGWDIDWGDGSAVQNVGDVSTVDHLYADGDANYTITATAITDQGSLIASPLAVTVNNVAPTLTVNGAAAATVGQAYTLTLSATDLGNDTITGWSIDWGDGPPEAVSANPGTVDHTYAAAGSYNIVATATDEDGDTIAAAVNVVASVPGAGATTYSEDNGLVVLEAEHYTASVAGVNDLANSSWTEVADTGTGGGAYVEGLPNDGDGSNTDGARLDFDVDFTNTGTYYMWVRMSGATPTDDSVHLGVDGVLLSDGGYGLTNNSGNWVWLNRVVGRPGADEVTASIATSGVHTVNLWMREDGVKVDRIILTDDANYTPSGIGPASTEIIGNTNNAPTDITLSNTSFSEDVTTDTLVGMLTTTDPDTGDTHTYSLVGGDTGSFTIANGNELRTVGTFDHEIQDSYSVSVRATDAANETFDKTFALTVTDVVETNPAAAISGAASIEEGGTYTLNLATTDAVTTGWDIDWGDGSAIETVGDVATAAHFYADGDANYSITATANTDQGLLASNSVAVSVNNVVPMLDVTGDGTVDVGETYTLTLGATDPGTDAITQWSIDWGDGSPADVLPGTATSATHVFSTAGTPNIIVTAADEDGTFVASALPVTVQTSASPTATISGVSSLDEGGSYTLGLAVADATVTGWDIDWGDGTPVVTIGDLASASHTYGDGSNTYNITASAMTDQGILLSNTLPLTVGNVAPTLTITGDATVEVGQTYTLALNATDPGDDTINQWSIDWGDGSTADVLAGTATSATHEFLYEGAFNVVATAIDEDGSYTSNTYTVSANYSATAAASISGPSTVDEGSLYTLGLALTDATATSWTIDWGDGTPAEDWVGYATEATHTYADGDANRTITATAFTDQGVLEANEALINVADVSPVITLSATNAATVGEAFTLGLAAFDPGNDVRSQWQIDWGDGSSVQIIDGGVGSQDHTYTVAGNYTISVSVTDEDDTHGAETYTVSVGDPVDVLDVDVSSTDIVENEELDLMVSPVGFTVDQWFMDFGDGQPVEIFGRNRFGGFVSFDFASSYFTSGSYELLLTAVSSSGDSAAAAPINLRVTGIDDIVRGDQFATSDIDYTVVLEATDPATGNTLTGWSIDWGDGSTSNPANGDTAAIHAYAAPGDYLVTGTANLSGGGQVVTTFSVTVEAPIINGVVPTIDASSTSSLVIQEGDEFTLQLNNNDYPVTSWTVDWGDPTWGGTETRTWPDRLLPDSSAEMSHQYRNANNASSVFTITSTVETVEGTIETNTINVTVEDVAPVSNITVPNKFKVGESVTLINSWYDPADQYDNRVYSIDWGDGNSDSPFGENDYASFRSHTYQAAGEYTITVTAVDESGTYTSTHEISSFRPDPVQSLDIEEIIDGAVVLTWAAADQATEYRVERSDVQGENWQTITTVTSGVTLYSDDSGVAGQRYLYRVTAINSLYEAEPGRETAGKFITATGDEDLDGLTNGEEVSLGLSVYDRDSDGDGLYDGWENTYASPINGYDPLVTNDASVDSDSDGLTDAQESGFSTNPNSVDTDGDGVSDRDEMANGTSPIDSSDMGTATHLYEEFEVSTPSSYFHLTALEAHKRSQWSSQGYGWDFGVNVGPYSRITSVWDQSNFDFEPASVFLRQGESYGVSVDLYDVNLHPDDRYITNIDDIPWLAYIHNVGVDTRGFFSESTEGLIGPVDTDTFIERANGPSGTGYDEDSGFGRARQGSGQIDYSHKQGTVLQFHVPGVNIRYADLAASSQQNKNLKIGQVEEIRVSLTENINYANPDSVWVRFVYEQEDFDVRDATGSLIESGLDYDASILGVDPGAGELALFVTAKQATAYGNGLTVRTTFDNQSGSGTLSGGVISTNATLEATVDNEPYISPIDIDIDSNNDGVISIDDEVFEDDPSRPGKILIPSTAQLPGGFIPIKLSVSEYDRNTGAQVRLVYDEYDSASPKLGGSVRLWSEDFSNNLSNASVLSGGHYISSDTPFLANLLDWTNDETTVYVESVEPTVNAESIRIESVLDTNRLASPLSDAIRVSTPTFNLQLDSNDDGLINDADDTIEFNSALANPWVELNYDDSDADAWVPDYADGYGLIAQKATPVTHRTSRISEDTNSQGDSFKVIRLTVSDGLVNPRLVFGYDANNPISGVSVDTYGYHISDGGNLRLWTKDASDTTRDGRSVDQGGSWIAANSEIDLSLLHRDSNGDYIIYLEGVLPSGSKNDLSIDATLVFDGTVSETLVGSTLIDSALVTVVGTAAAWQTEAFQKADVDPVTWLNAINFGFDPVGRAHMISVYEYYNRTFQSDPNNLLWMGLGRMAGGAVMNGIDLIEAIRDHVINPAGNALQNVPHGILQAWDPFFDLSVTLGQQWMLDEIDWYQERFMLMQREIFLDLAWQHQAWVTGGFSNSAIELLDEYQSNTVAPQVLAMWADLATGNTIDANAEIIRREQGNNVLQPHFNAINLRFNSYPLSGWSSEAATLAFSIMTPNPLDATHGALAFRNHVPGGSVISFNDRVTNWTLTHMYPIWHSVMSPTERINFANDPIGSHGTVYAP